MAEKLTTQEGQPWANNQHSLTAGQRGPVLIQDYQLFEKLAHFDRERIPERVVHAKGAGAKGVFQVTHDMSAYTKADLFNGEVRKRHWQSAFHKLPVSWVTLTPSATFVALPSSSTQNKVTTTSLVTTHQFSLLMIH